MRALIGAFAQGNPTQFNRADGAGYDFVADNVLALDPKNPQVAARLATAFRTWRTLEPGRRGKAQAALERIKAAPNLSRDLADIVERALGCAAKTPQYQRISGWRGRSRRLPFGRLQVICG